jgi:hypothetical protein
MLSATLLHRLRLPPSRLSVLRFLSLPIFFIESLPNGAIFNPKHRCLLRQTGVDKWREKGNTKEVHLAWTCRVLRRWIFVSASLVLVVFVFDYNITDYGCTLGATMLFSINSNYFAYGQ